MQLFNLILLYWFNQVAWGAPVDPKGPPSMRVDGRDALQESFQNLASIRPYGERQPTAISGDAGPFENMRHSEIPTGRSQTQSSQIRKSISALEEVSHKILCGSERWKLVPGECENLTKTIQILKEIERSGDPSSVSASDEPLLAHANELDASKEASANSQAIDWVNRLRSTFTKASSSTAPPEFTELLDHSVLQTMNNLWKKSLVDRETLHEFFDDDLTLKKIAFHSLRHPSGGKGIFPQFTVEPTFKSISEFWALLNLNDIIKAMEKHHQKTLVYHAINFEVESVK